MLNIRNAHNTFLEQRENGEKHMITIMIAIGMIILTVAVGMLVLHYQKKQYLMKEVPQEIPIDLKNQNNGI